MLVLLPPSETKAPGGSARRGPLRLESLSFPTLNTVRSRLLDELVALAADPASARRVLKLTDHQDAELALNVALRDAATMPALHRYTGVLYDGLGYRTLDADARRRANKRIVVVSALFGALRPTDPIPAYRLSGSTILPGAGSLRRLWAAALGPVLRDAGFVVDLRSGAYQALAPVPGAVTVRVLTPGADGELGVVSHFNKHYKGQLAQALVATPGRIGSVAGVMDAAADAGLKLVRTGPTTLDLLV
jgi:cytoplasmic iron level regulating protein YaaA (DUF328/UPF0246 family)